MPDRHPIVRAVARAALLRAGSDPAIRYRRHVAQEEPAPGRPRGSARPATPRTRTYWGGACRTRTRGRVEAIRALRRVGVTMLVDPLPLLRDASGAVTRQAVASLPHEIGVPDPVMLDGLLSPGNAPHVRLAGYQLLIIGDAWQRFTTDLRLVDDPDERLRAGSRADIAVWLDRQAATTYRAPTRTRAAQLDELMERAQPILGERTVRLLRFHAGLTHSAAP